jgi:hypothetical protein
VGGGHWQVTLNRVGFARVAVQCWARQNSRSQAEGQRKGEAAGPRNGVPLGLIRRKRHSTATDRQ